MNVTKELIDKYNVRREEIAYFTGASFSSVGNWYEGIRKPLTPFQERLTILLKQKEKQAATEQQ